jgi:ERCC4-related helicase
MPNEKIKTALKKLHGDLSSAINATPSNDALCTDTDNAVDTELQNLLTTVANDINAYLESEKIADSNKHGFAHRLDEIATDFSIEHPKLDTVLEEIKRILLGIGA